MEKYEFIDRIKEINKIDKKILAQAKLYQESLAKPIRSLGGLEEIAIQIAGIKGSIHYDFNRFALMVFASDNGVVKEGVSSTPQSVTYSQSINLTRHITGAATLAKEFGCDVKVYDLGVIGDTSNSNVIQRKIRESTDDIFLGPAMTREECMKAIQIGFDAIKDNKDNYDAFALGEMGIGNTTTSSAIIAALTGLSVEEVTGKGAGLSEEAYQHKIDVIKHAININNINKDDVYDVASKLGGFDICALLGAYLACAYYHKLAIIDGFISATAAYLAFLINKDVKDYMMASHKSYEIGFMKIMKEMELNPYLDLNMRLGEGSGAVLAISLIKAACAIENKMGTFKQANINDDYLQELKIGDKFSVKEK